MDYVKFDEELKRLISCYQKLDEEAYCKIAPCCLEDKVQEIENNLSLKFPQQIRSFFLQYSSCVDFCAFLPDDFCDTLPDELSEIFSACFQISLDEVERAEENRLDWVKSVFLNEDDEYDKVWHNKLGIMTVGNGDIIALDIIHDKENPSVVYLSHDGGEGHGAILGKDFNTFLVNLIKIGGCGNEDWQMLPFITDSEAGINPDCENAKKYRELIGYDLESYS